jgi:hypothetical protein
MQKAACAAAGGTLYVPTGRYLISGAGIEMPGEVRVIFSSRAAVLQYTGNKSALTWRNKKRIEWYSGTIDLSRAAGDAVALDIRGLWFGTFYDLSIRQGAVSSTGISIQTSQKGGDNWGAYLLKFINLDMQEGAGKYGIRTWQTPGDAVAVTHLSVDGGWLHCKDYGFYLQNVSDFSTRGTAIEGGANDGIYVTDSNDVVLAPGEIGGYRGYAINLGKKADAVTVLIPSGANASNGKGFINRVESDAAAVGRDRIRLMGSREDPAYSVELSSVYSHSNAVRLTARGGGHAAELLRWGDDHGLLVTGGGGRGLTVETDYPAARIGFFGKKPVVRPVVSPAAADAATTRELVNSLRKALIELGLVN